MTKISVFAPATMANIGVGFDVLGAALAPIDGTNLGDTVHAEACSELLQISCVGHFAERLPRKKEDNLVYKAWEIFCSQLNDTPRPVHLTLDKNMPIGSGLGSSACSSVATLVALNHWHDHPFHEQHLLQMMGLMEAQISGTVHYDNVAPSFLGGLQLIVDTEVDHELCITQSLPYFEDWYWVMAYSGIEVSTAAARAILPPSYRCSDAVSYGRNLAGFIHACYTHQQPLATALMHDVIAEPYREHLLPNYGKTKKQVLRNGALTMGISGSGPTVFAVCDRLEIAQQVAATLNELYLQTVEGFVHICKIREEGASLV